MITLQQYFGSKVHTAQHEDNAADLIERVEALWQEAVSVGVPRYIDPDTGTEISGSRGGSGDGGFRLPTATTGKPSSSHKEGKGVDCFDKNNDLDKWLDLFELGDGRNTKLEEYGLYREHPGETITWCHLTTRAPGSGKRTFYP